MLNILIKYLIKETNLIFSRSAIKEKEEYITNIDSIIEDLKQKGFTLDAQPTATKLEKETEGETEQITRALESDLAECRRR